MVLVFAVAAAAVAWVIFTIIPETWRTARIPVTIVAGIMGAMNGFSHGGGVTTTDDVERQLVESEKVGELARAFRDAQPAEFATYVEDVRQAMREGAESEAMARAALRLQLAAQERIGTLPDAGIVDYYSFLRDQKLELRSTQPALCRALLYGGAETEVVPLSDAMIGRQMQIYATAFRAGAGVAHAPYSDEEWEVRLTDIRERVYNVVGDDIVLMAENIDVAGREPRACEVIAELYNQLSLAPDAGRLYVTMNRRGQSEL